MQAPPLLPLGAVHAWAPMKGFYLQMRCVSPLPTVISPAEWEVPTPDSILPHLLPWLLPY